jgi:hypothetical protein
MKNPTIIILSDLEIRLLEQEIKREKLPVVARPLTKEEEKEIDQVIKDNSSLVAQS